MAYAAYERQSIQPQAAHSSSAKPRDYGTATRRLLALAFRFRLDDDERANGNIDRLNDDTFAHCH